jgi:hypothetical protein
MEIALESFRKVEFFLKINIFIYLLIGFNENIAHLPHFATKHGGATDL